MADNVQAGTAVGLGDMFATDQIGTVHYPINKLAYGPLDTATLVTTTSGLPVQGTVNMAGTVPVSGTVGVSGTVPVTVSGTANVNVTGGTVNVNPISGTVAVSGNVEITNDVGNPIPVSLTSTTITGNVEVTNDVGNPLPVSWTGQSVSVTGTANVHETGTALVQGTVNVAGTVPVNVTGTALVQGTVSVAGTVPVSGTVGVSGTVPVTASGGTVTAKISSQYMDAAGANLTPKFAVVNGTASGWGTVIAGTAGYRIRVVSYLCNSAGTTVIKFGSGTANDITGPMTVYPAGGVSKSYCPVGHFEAGAGTPLMLNLSVAGTIGGHLTYVEVA